MSGWLLDFKNVIRCCFPFKALMSWCVWQWLDTDSRTLVVTATHPKHHRTSLWLSVLHFIWNNVGLFHTFPAYCAFRFIFQACPLWKKSTQKLLGMERELYTHKDDTVLLKIYSKQHNSNITGTREFYPDKEFPYVTLTTLPGVMTLGERDLQLLAEGRRGLHCLLPAWRHL